MRSGLDNALCSVLEIAAKHITFSEGLAQHWFEAMDWLFECAKMGCRLRDTYPATLGYGPVTVGYPGYIAGVSYPKVEMRERKILTAKGPTTAVSYHLQWKDANDKSKGFEIVRYTGDNDPGERYDVK